MKIKDKYQYKKLYGEKKPYQMILESPLSSSVHGHYPHVTYFLEITALFCVQPVRYSQRLVCVVHTMNIDKKLPCIKNVMVLWWPSLLRKWRRENLNIIGNDTVLSVHLLRLSLVWVTGSNWCALVALSPQLIFILIIATCLLWLSIWCGCWDGSWGPCRLHGMKYPAMDEKDLQNSELLWNIWALQCQSIYGCAANYLGHNHWKCVFDHNAVVTLAENALFPQDLNCNIFQVL